MWHHLDYMLGFSMMHNMNILSCKNKHVNCNHWPATNNWSSPNSNFCFIALLLILLVFIVHDRYWYEQRYIDIGPSQIDTSLRLPYSLSGSFGSFLRVVEEAKYLMYEYIQFREYCFVIWPCLLYSFDLPVIQKKKSGCSSLSWKRLLMVSKFYHGYLEKVFMGKKLI